MRSLNRFSDLKFGARCVSSSVMNSATTRSGLVTNRSLKLSFTRPNSLRRRSMSSSSISLFTLVWLSGSPCSIKSDLKSVLTRLARARSAFRISTRAAASVNRIFFRIGMLSMAVMLSTWISAVLSVRRFFPVRALMRTTSIGDAFATYSLACLSTDVKCSRIRPRSTAGKMGPISAVRGAAAGLIAANSRRTARSCWISSWGPAAVARGDMPITMERKFERDPITLRAISPRSSSAIW
mmetsp:Transcript_16617/g.63173  ORF Transcript_16617/g.63173 Transcript_16617/m.63173 type:complete len:239 (-) Transcript_16617:3364-4080(-)